MPFSHLSTGTRRIMTTQKRKEKKKIKSRRKGGKSAKSRCMRPQTSRIHRQIFLSDLRPPVHIFPAAFPAAAAGTLDRTCRTWLPQSPWVHLRVLLPLETFRRAAWRGQPRQVPRFQVAAVAAAAAAPPPPVRAGAGQWRARSNIAITDQAPPSCVHTAPSLVPVNFFLKKNIIIIIITPHQRYMPESARNRPGAVRRRPAKPTDRCRHDAPHRAEFHLATPQRRGCLMLHEGTRGYFAPRQVPKTCGDQQQMGGPYQHPSVPTYTQPVSTATRDAGRPSPSHHLPPPHLSDATRPHGLVSELPAPVPHFSGSVSPRVIFS